MILKAVSSLTAMIIGVTGMYASGKDSVAHYLEKKGFIHYSLSDEIREECRLRKVKITRDNLISVANELRAKFGPRVLADRVRIKMKLQQGKNIVVTSIRNPEELRSLQEEKQFVLVNVHAEEKKRFEWLTLRAREEDPKTFKEFREKEKVEQSSDPTKQQLHKVITKANIVVHNEGTIEDLQGKVDKLLADLGKKFQEKRPGWDEYFMGIVDAVSKRATCDRGRTAVVIVRDKRILATGYVGAPMGLPHCDEVGHEMKKLVHEDGRTSQHCVRTSHGEVNAIALAARNGVSIERGTLYCKLAPCYNCAKMLINAGIIRVVCQKRYHSDQDTPELLRKAKVQLVVLDNTVEKYANQ